MDYRIAPICKEFGHDLEGDRCRACGLSVPYLMGRYVRTRSRFYEARLNVGKACESATRSLSAFALVAEQCMAVEEATAIIEG